MLKVGVCLSGCGFLDGSEIQEAVCTLLALDRAGAQAICLAPNLPQAEVVDHRSGLPVPGHVHNVLTESARIARGNIKDLAGITARDLDALIFPGGYGAAKNLCTFAKDGPECTVNPEVARLIGEMLDMHKPIGAICIAPVLLARVLGDRGLTPRLTIGDDPGTAAALGAMGAEHCECGVREHVVDEELRLVSTPAYMLGSAPAEVYDGIARLVQDVLRLAGAPVADSHPTDGHPAGVRPQSDRAG